MPFPTSCSNRHVATRAFRRPIGIIAIAAGLFFAAAAQAGQWTLLPVTDEFEECGFAFTGEISSGDLTAIVTHPAWSEGFRRRVCLDSPGGSLKEVYDFVTLEGGEGLGFATTIKSGARCESSCAILFMFGQSWGANSPYPDRVMEPGARLGFHSPFLANMTVAEDQREDAFRVALDVAKLLMDKSYKAITMAGPPLSSELVSLVLNTPGDQMHYVDTVGEMQLLGIGQPFETEARIRIASDRGSVGALAERICLSSYAMTFRQHVVTEGYSFDDLVRFVDDMTGPENGLDVRNLVHIPATASENAKIVGVLTGPLSVPGWYSAGAALYCRVEFSAEVGNGTYEIDLSRSYNLSFGRAFDLDEIAADEIPGPDDGYTYDVFPAGMIPIDTRY